MRGLILSMHPEELVALRALRAGASGYVQKEAAEDDLIVAIRSIAAGGNYVRPGRRKLRPRWCRPSVTTLLHERLSDREFEVFRLLGSGHSVSDIAKARHLSVNTVSTHRTRILQKTGLHTNTDIVHYVTTNAASQAA